MTIPARNASGIRACGGSGSDSGGSSPAHKGRVFGEHVNTMRSHGVPGEVDGRFGSCGGSARRCVVFVGWIRRDCGGPARVALREEPVAMDGAMRGSFMVRRLGGVDVIIVLDARYVCAE